MLTRVALALRVDPSSPKARCCAVTLPKRYMHMRWAPVPHDTNIHWLVCVAQASLCDLLPDQYDTNAFL